MWLIPQFLPVRFSVQSEGALARIGVAPGASARAGAPV
jgi:hypothetical protein